MIRMREIAKQIFKSLTGQIMLLFLAIAMLAHARTTGLSSLELKPEAGDTNSFTIYNASATPVFNVAQAGTITASSFSFALANGESINTDTDAVFDFTRNTSGAVSITASDDNAVAALTILPGGAAAMTLGGTTATSMTHIVDNDYIFQNGATGASMVLDIATDTAAAPRVAMEAIAPLESKTPDVMAISPSGLREVSKGPRAGEP